MKSKLASVLTVILFFAITANFNSFAQNKETKNSDNKIKTTVQKIETKKEDVKQTAGTITHKQHKQLKGGINTVKKEVKTEDGKDMKKMNNENKKKVTVDSKLGKNSDKKIKN